MKEALFYLKQENNTVQCCLCRHCCRITAGQLGRCRVRYNDNGTLYSLVYGKVIAEHADPIEKKPLYHVLPGSRSYSVATAGCNFTCRHCQNYEISQLPENNLNINGIQREPEAIVEDAASFGCTSISYTYTEPTVYFEFAYDTAKAAAANNIKNVFVTNGYISRKPLEMLAPYLDAANIDLKGYSEHFYRTVCGASLHPVLDAIEMYHSLGVWVEITTLIIPGYNDSPGEIQDIARYIARVDTSIPWHVTAFYPTYNLMDASRPDADILLNARQKGLDAGLKYVYTGNIPGAGGENTYCSSCGCVLIKRSGFRTQIEGLENGRCSACSTALDGILH